FYLNLEGFFVLCDDRFDGFDGFDRFDGTFFLLDLFYLMIFQKFLEFTHRNEHCSRWKDDTGE
ncbi:MAG: hypothetical protein OEZ34_16775, partial [Spirochaetia bacterium]|nr:hypothetical protein [Spirochaetia bacterium]